MLKKKNGENFLLLRFISVAPAWLKMSFILAEFFLQCC